MLTKYCSWLLLLGGVIATASRFPNGRDALDANIIHHEHISESGIRTWKRRSASAVGDNTQIQAHESSHEVEYRLEAFDQILHLILSPHLEHSEHIRRSAPAGSESFMYTGTLRSDNRVGTANGYMYDGHYHGIVRTEQETYFIEPAQKFAKYSSRRSADRVVYRASDVLYTHPKGHKFNGVDLFPPISVVMQRNRRNKNEEARAAEVEAENGETDTKASSDREKAKQVDDKPNKKESTNEKENDDKKEEETVREDSDSENEETSGKKSNKDKKENEPEGEEDSMSGEKGSKVKKPSKNKKEDKDGDLGKTDNDEAEGSPKEDSDEPVVKQSGDEKIESKGKDQKLEEVNSAAIDSESEGDNRVEQATEKISKPEADNKNENKSETEDSDSKVKEAATLMDEDDSTVGSPKEVKSDVTDKKSSDNSKKKNETPKGTCELKLVADHTFTSRFPTDTAAAKHMSLIASEIDNIFSETAFALDVRVALSKKNPLSIFSSNDSYPEDLSKLADESLSPTTVLAEFAKGDWDGYCLAHLFTHREHHGILGEAYEAHPILGRFGGICANSTQSEEGLNLNTGMHTNLMYGHSLSLAVEIIAATHTIGHGFGASHDPFHTGPCLGGLNHNRYLMTDTSFNELKANGDDFSTCSIDSINRVLESDKMAAESCLVREPTKICGNGILEGDEECDTYGATKCCTKDCKLAEKAVCSAADDCCDPDTCDYAAKDTVCREASNCMKQAVCNGKKAVCPEQRPERDFTPCGSGDVLTDAWVCMTGTCGNELEGKRTSKKQGWGFEGNLCAAFDGARSCECPMKENECQLCCTFAMSDDDTCQTVESYCALDDTTDEACFNGDKDLASTQSVSAFFEGGYPCANYKGHCDGRGTCNMAIIPKTPVRHHVLLDEPLWRPLSKPVHSNFISLSMEYSTTSIYHAFVDEGTSPKIEALLELLTVEKGERPTYIRIGGNSVMKMDYASSQHTYPDYVFIEKTISNETLVALKNYGERSGSKYIMALPMMEPDPKYAVEFGEAIVDIFGGTDMIYALEMGNEPDHWGDNKKEKVNLLKMRPHYDFKGHGRITFEDYLLEVTDTMIPALAKSKQLRKVGLQSPAIAGSNTNTWPHWNDNLVAIHDGMTEAMIASKMASSDQQAVTAFHRYGMSGYSVWSSMEIFMADPPTDGSDEPRNTMEWIGRVANEIAEKGGEFVHGEGNTVTGSGRSILKGLRGIDRSYEAGVWMFNNLLELASRNVTRSHVHGVCGSTFAPLYVPYRYFDVNEPDFKTLRVTPLYGAMYFFNRLLDGGKDAVRISVPSAYIGVSVGNPPKASDPVGVNPYYRHYLMQNEATKRQSLIYIHKDPTAHAAWMNIEIPRDFCPSQTELAVQRMTRQRRSEIQRNDFDQYTTNLDGIWFDNQAIQYGTLNNETATLDKTTELWHITMEPLTAVVVICDSLADGSSNKNDKDKNKEDTEVEAVSETTTGDETDGDVDAEDDNEEDDVSAVSAVALSEEQTALLAIEDGDSEERKKLKQRLQELFEVAGDDATDDAIPPADSQESDSLAAETEDSPRMQALKKALEQTKGEADAVRG